MRDIIYVTSPELHQSLDNIAKIRQRSYLVDALIQAYELDKHDHFRTVQPLAASEQDLSLAHDRDYLDFLNTIAAVGDEDDDQLYKTQMDFYKIGYECPPFEQLPSFCSLKRRLLAAIDTVLFRRQMDRRRVSHRSEVSQ